MESDNSRRSFFGKAAVAGGIIASATQTAYAAPRKKSPGELMNIGVIVLGEYSHLPGIWGPIINTVAPENWPMQTYRMRISHCWDSKPDVSQKFAKQYGCEAVKNYYDMVGKVDGIIFAGMYEVKWWPQLTKPYLEAGIPCFINRPFAISMKDARDMLETAKKHNTPILSTDAHEDLKEALLAEMKVKTLLKEGKRIYGANVTTDAHEYPAHGVHGLYMLYGVFGTDVEQVSLQSPGWWSAVTPSSKKTMDWGLLTLQYRGINKEKYGKQTTPFIATVQTIPGNNGSRATCRLHYQGGWSDFDEYRLDEKEYLTDQRYHLQAKTIFNMQKLFETGQMPQSYDYIEQKTRIFLTGFKSHIDHEGRMLRVNELPDDWEAPVPFPDWIDESIFS